MRHACSGHWRRWGLRSAILAGLFGLAGPWDATGQSLPGAPAPVPGGLLDPGRNAKPAPAKPREAEPKGEAKPAVPPKPATAAPRPPAAAPKEQAPREQARPRQAPKEAPKPAAAKGPPPPSLPKLEPLKLRVPAEYRDPKAAKRSDTEVLLSAVGADLAPRFAKGGRCAAAKTACPDFTNLIVFRTYDGVAATVARRYKAPPESLRTFAAAHDLSQIPPRAARGYNTRHFLSVVDGRPVWIVCHRYDSPKKPRPESRYCDLTFDVAEGIGGRLIFHEARLADWRRMHAAAVSLAGRLRG